MAIVDARRRGHDVGVGLQRLRRSGGNLGARSVIVTDVVDYRLAVSRVMRATHCINAAKEIVVDTVADITGGKMADVVIEAVGHQPDTINDCLDLVKRGGTVVAFGVPDQKIYPFRFAEIGRAHV